MPKRDRDGRKKKKTDITVPQTAVTKAPQKERSPRVVARKVGELTDEIVSAALALTHNVTEPHRNAPNRLYYGDNLDVLRRHIPDESVDLVYLDPPFNSNANYNVLFAARDGTQAAAQIQAFEDTWEWNEQSARQFAETVEEGGPVADVLLAFQRFIPASDMLAYLAMMAPRLVELRRVLKPTGALYLHCDQNASHYLKLLLDAVFGPENFRNDIVWKRKAGRGETNAAAIRFGVSADNILFYARSKLMKLNRQYGESNPEYIASKFTHIDENGRRYRLDNITSPSPRPNLMYEYKGITPPPKGWAVSRDRMEQMDKEGRLYIPTDPSKRIQRKRYLDELPGETIDSLWTDIPPINSQAQERLGYPTQKPEALLERIIGASSNLGDVVLDPFCGCGTTVAAAQKLGRSWIGIDITHLAIGLIKTRLRDAYSDAAQYEVMGEPTTVEDAAELAVAAPYQFQAWALGLVGARQSGGIRKGADKGVDGRLYFHDGTGITRQIVFSVKAGKLHANHVRDLRGVVEREKADLGVLLSFDEPTRAMRQEAASAGFYESPWGKHSRIQLLTVGELLDGKSIDYPRTAGINRTFKAAPKARIVKEHQLGVFDTIGRNIAAAERFPDEVTNRAIQMFREARLSSSDAAKRLRAVISDVHVGPGLDIPRYRDREAFVDWLNRLASLLSASELLHFATVIRNQLVHGGAVSAWPLRQSADDDERK